MKKSVNEYRVRGETLNHQLTQTDRERSLLELDVKNWRRKEEMYMEENIKLKEEVRH